MKKVLVVGHCNMDHPRIASLVEDNFDAKATRAEMMSDTKKFLEEDDFDLLIINRIGAFDQKSGIELIKEIKNEGKSKASLMLVTNYQDHMDLAVENGGVPGFGKDALSSKETLKILGTYLS